MKKIFTVFISALLVFSVTALSQENNSSWSEVVNVKVSGQSEKAAKLSIETTGKPKFHVFKVSNPPRLVVEMVDAVHNWPKKEFELNGPLIKRIRSGQYKNQPVKVVRVVLDMQIDNYVYEETSSDRRIIISVGSDRESINELDAKKTKAPEKKAVKTAGRKKFHLEPNVPTEEHMEKVRKILSEKQARLKEYNQRLAKIKSAESAKKEKTAGYVSLYDQLGSDPVDFNFKNADIREVLRTFELKLNRNLIPSAGVTGEVTLRLKQVPFNEAFKLLLERHDLVAVQQGSVIQIMNESEIPTDRRTFYLKNRTAGELKTTITGLLTTEEEANTTVTTDDASNSIIVTATTEVLSKIEALIRQLDIKSPQIKIKARLIEIQASKDKTHSISWLGSVPFDNETADPYFGKYIAPRFGKDAGDFDSAEWDKGTHRLDLDEFNIVSPGGFLGISAVMDQLDLHATLNFIASKTNSNTISEPTILTENNKSAKIHVGRNLPVRTVEVTETGTTQSVEFISEGVDMSVTPVVSPGSDQIALTISVKVSEFLGFQADNPITTERSADTQVTIQSGKTVVIGGLIRERVTDTNTGVPVLKDIPLIGYLFKNKQSTKERSELLVFLTPEIIIE